MHHTCIGSLRHDNSNDRIFGPEAAPGILETDGKAPMPAGVQADR